MPLRDPCRFVMDLWARGFPGASWNSVGLSPVSVVSRCIRARSRNTLSVVRANRVVLGTDQVNLVDASAAQGAWHTDKAEVTPPGLSLPGPSVAGHCCPTLAA